MDYKLIKSEVVHRGVVFDLQVDEIEFPTGNRAIREVALHLGGAVIVALTDDYKVLFVNQFRYPFQKYTLELPAGKLNLGEDPESCAVRELEEETGYIAKKMTKLGVIVTTPGFCTEVLHVYLAEELEHGKQTLEEGEQGLEIKSFTIKEIDKLIAEGAINDAKTISGIYLTKMHCLS